MLNILLALRGDGRGLAGALHGHKVRTIKYNHDTAAELSKEPCDVAIIEGGLEELSTLKRRDPRVEVILVGSAPSIALDAIQKGASAFYTHPLPIKSLKEMVLKIDKLNMDRRETNKLEKNLREKYRFDGIIGKNLGILDIFNFIRRIAPYYKTITIAGETGTGKELVARAIHSSSPAAKRPFVAFNCGGIVEDLVESELFGHKKGAFTGAFSDNPGLIETAGEGTLFLDEIGDMPLKVQPHLLRVLENHEYRHLGSNKTIKMSCRIVAASNRDLSVEVKKGRFRKDLFYRLSAISLKIPPLRDRKDDIPLLFRFFLDEFNKRTGKGVRGITRTAQERLIAYDWPGNVRELKNAVERAAMLTCDDFIRPEDLFTIDSGIAEAPSARVATLERVIKEHLKTILELCDGNRTRASRLLGISRRSLIRKIEKYSLR